MQILDIILATLSNPEIVKSGSIGVEVLLRLWPTSKPVSLLLGAASLLDKAQGFAQEAVQVIGKAADIVRLADSSLNAIIPQRIKPAPAQAPAQPAAPAAPSA